MSTDKDVVPPLPPISRQENRKTKEPSSLVPIIKESKELPELKRKSSVTDRWKHSPPSLKNDYIPEEIFVALTSAANPVPCPSYLRPPKKTKRMKDFQGCVRTADGVWQHSVRRNKFRYLIQNPICLTGAGRDVSFLYDVIAEKQRRTPPPTPEPDKTASGTNLKQETGVVKSTGNIGNSLVPEEFHVVKNRGVIGLEYYDDKYTTLLEDHENRLRVFPSMKPSGRLEVIQLMKVMDTMLEKAGVDNEATGVTGLSQMHNVLELMKVEQNIYNIVFHELIRQVSVDCVERGELLSKLRQRYVLLLDRIPRQMRNLYKEMMAQRVMDKHITEELFKFKEAVGKLTRELQTVREHDRRAIVDVEMAHEKLARAIWDSELNANLLDEYRELYELQRARLEAQIHQLTEEKELWSGATYDLALKVIEKNKVILARRLYASEKAWTNVMKHFTVLLASEDAMDLSSLQQLTQEYRELVCHIGLEVKQAEDAIREPLYIIQDGLDGWLTYFREHVLLPATAVEVLSQCLAAVVKWLMLNMLKLHPDKTGVMLVGKTEVLDSIMLPIFNGIQLTLAVSLKSLGVILDPALLRENGKGSYSAAKGATLLDEIMVDLKNWEKILNRQLDMYGGDVHLARKEPVVSAAKLQKQWMELGTAILSRHKTLNGKMPPEWKLLENINKTCNNLCQQYSIRIGGENGITRILTSLINGLEDWTFRMLASKQKSGMHESDWVKFFQTVSDWLLQITDLLKFIGTCETPEDRRLRTTNAPVEPEDIFKKIQQWILTATNGSEKGNVQLAQEMTEFHNILSNWMVNLLLIMVPDHSSRETLPLTDAEVVRQAEHKLLDVFRLEGEAANLAVKFSKFSSYIVSCCKDMVTSITRRKLANFDPDAEYELRQLEKIKTECIDWIQTCSLLLSGMKTTPTTLISTEELISLFGAEALQPKLQLPLHPEQDIDASPEERQEIPEERKKDKIQESGSKEVQESGSKEVQESGSKEVQESGSKEVQESGSKKDLEMVAEKHVLETEEPPPVPGPSTDQQAASATSMQSIRYIGPDSNVHVRTIETEQVTVSGRELYASQWTTKYSSKEFEMLASLEILEERLLEAEKRAQQAEEKSEHLHEKLEEALSKLQDLEDGAPKEEPTLETSSTSDSHFKEEPDSSSRVRRSSTKAKKSTKPKR